MSRDGSARSLTITISFPDLPGRSYFGASEAVIFRSADRRGAVPAGQQL